MIWCIKKCQFCKSENVVKKGKQLGRQRYKCNACGRQWQNKTRKQKLTKKIWKEYTYGRQTAKDLGQKYNRSRKWISRQLKEINVDDNKIINISPRSIVVIADATFFSRSEGLLIFREPNLKQNLIWKEIHTETTGQYCQLKLELEIKGFRINAAILDGRPGVREVFGNIPVQMCHFHQVAIVRRYLTSRPKLEAAKELLFIARQLTKSNEKDFSELLLAWNNKWREFLKEKTINPFTSRWFYTHKRLRAAFRSLNNNLPYLFTYQKYPELNIPNTTNSLDGYITTLKNFIRIHRGIQKEKRSKFINQILKSIP